MPNAIKLIDKVRPIEKHSVLGSSDLLQRKSLLRCAMRVDLSQRPFDTREPRGPFGPKRLSPKWAAHHVQRPAVEAGEIGDFRDAILKPRGNFGLANGCLTL